MISNPYLDYKIAIESKNEKMVVVAKNRLLHLLKKTKSLLLGLANDAFIAPNVHLNMDHTLEEKDLLYSLSCYLHNELNSDHFLRRLLLNKDNPFQ